MLGAISVNEMTAALDRERTAALASIAALKGRRDVVAPIRPGAGGPSSLNTANIAAQFQDVAVTSAMGMSPIQIALQQGTQLSAVLNTMGGARGAISGLAQAFMSIVNPVSLVTLGLVAGRAALIQYVMSIKSDLPSAEDALKSQADLIQKIEERWPAATAAMKAYSRENAAVLEANARQNAAVLEEAARKAADAFTKQVGLSSFITGGSTYGIDTQFKPFEVAITRLQSQIKEGKPDFESFYQSIKDTVATDPSGLEKVGVKVTQLAGALEAADQQAESARASVSVFGDKVAAAFEKAQIAIDALNPTGASGRLSDIETRLDTLFKKMQAGEANSSDLARAVNSLTSLNPDLSAPINEIARLGQAALDAMTKVQGLQNTGTGDRLRGPGRSQNEFDDALSFFLRTDKDLADRLTTKNKEIDRAAKPKIDRDANAYRDLAKNANDRIEQMRLEQELIGKTGVAQDTLRFKMDLIKKATDRGRSLTAAHRAELEKLAETYGKVAEATAKATLRADLQFEREQMFRSPIDQTIASTLRGAGLPVDFNSYEAGLIRTNEQLKEARSLAGDFASTFIQGVEQGKSVFESLGDAALSVLDRITEKLLNEVLDALFQVGSAGGGGILGSLLGGLLGGGASAFAVTPGAGLFANGDAFPDGVHGFTDSIVNSPTLFKFAKGAGLMGEAGPEAIMPLKRDSSGRLGVSAAGGGAANNNRPIQQSNTYHIDARGAQPGVENQIRAALEEYDRRVLPESVKRVQDDPYRRD